jgi:hypothetical protein
MGNRLFYAVLILSKIMSESNDGNDGVENFLDCYLTDQST